jgi:hypothetical protein
VETWKREQDYINSFKEKKHMKQKMGTGTTIKINRDAETGKFVTEEYVEKHPKTTVTEIRKITPKKK